MAGGTSIELLLHEVNQRLEQLQGELAAERELRRGLEKQNFQLQALAAQAEKALADLEIEKKERLELERKLAAVETEMKHASSLAKNVEQKDWFAWSWNAKSAPSNSGQRRWSR